MALRQWHSVFAPLVPMALGGVKTSVQGDL